MSGGGTTSGRRNNVSAKANTTAASEVYKEFADMSVASSGLAGFSYGEDAAETVKWFEKNSNFRSLIAEMSVNDKVAFQNFSKGYFMYGQQYKGFSKMTAEEQDWTRTYDKFLDKSEVNANVKVVRLATATFLFGKGKRTATLEELKAMNGKVVTSKANLSTAAAKEGLSVGDLTKQVEYKIYIPKGSKGAGMYTGVDDTHKWGVKQREFMLNRDTRWQVGDTKWNDKRKIFETDLFFVEQMPHDYS